MMQIRAIHVRRFRSIQAASVRNCGGLNVFIGKNNAGKSNILATIDLALTHLRGGRVSTLWTMARRFQDEFYGRETTTPIQIGIEFQLDPSVNSDLRAELRKDAPQLERAIEELSQYNTLSVIVAGAVDDERPFLTVQAIGVGEIATDSADLRLEGKSLLAVSQDVAKELFAIDREAIELRRELAALEQLSSENAEVIYAGGRDPDRLRFTLGRILDDPRPTLVTTLTQLFKTSDNATDFARSIAQLANEVRTRASAAEQRKTSNPIVAYAGDVHTPPPYAMWIMKQCGSTRLLHFRENKAPIGAEEAAALLNLKVRRGGEDRLRVVRQTVQSLLGVSVDAFEAEDSPGDRVGPLARRRRTAEMDIDNFVLEANGAGIREALRLILDIELKKPDLVLVEEPEIHLHPGLEYAMHGYLREKSRDVQIFITTHSTNFVDTAALQNVYMVTRTNDRSTTSEALLLDSALDRVPSELGLRLSTVFMFDRLIFVEGKSDEDVLRELARRLGIDLTAGNVGFVQMGGVQNFAHFAAEATLELLSRRQIRMWFLVDRDERTDDEVASLIAKLGGRATLHVLNRRELDNYLINARAVTALITEKLRLGGSRVAPPLANAVATALTEATDSAKEEVVRLRVEKELLASVHLQGRRSTGEIAERISRAITNLQSRLARVDEVTVTAKEAVETEWRAGRTDFAPGALVLDRALSALAGLRYSKTTDGPRLARLLEPHEISPDLVALLKAAAGVVPC